MVVSLADGVAAFAQSSLLETTRSGGVDVDVNWTFVVQIGIFLVLFLLLKPLLFDPMLRLFEERERRIEGAKNEAREMYQQADRKIALYEEQLTAVKRQASEERDKLRAAGQRQEQQILSTVRAETNMILEQGKAKIARDGATLRAELDGASQTLAREIASRVLGREVQ